MDRNGYWTIGDMRRQSAILSGTVAPTLVLQSAVYLNTYLKTWIKANIWTDRDRIVYVGNNMPVKTESTEIIDCSGLTLVPGYIEPHVHPGQLYNPQTLAQYAAPLGTTALICDNALLVRSLTDEKAFQIIEKLERLPETFYWWCRYDPQSEVYHSPFTDERIYRWLHHPRVVQGGELTGWPRVVHGDDQMLSWMRATKHLRKPIESHLPGASERTLTRLKLFGADGDHEAMTGDEALARLKLGYMVSLRYSPIRPDLPEILRTLLKKGVRSFDHVTMTLDGATPGFLKKGVCDQLIQIALEAGITPTDAYMMVSANIASHYHLGDRIGHIAPGRIANINFLNDSLDPRPVSVLAKGRWVRRHNKMVADAFSGYDLAEDLTPLEITASPDTDSLQASTRTGIDMVNDVITRSFELEPGKQLPDSVLYLTLLDKKGTWIRNTYLRGFAARLSGFAGSFTATGDLLLMGRNKSDMITAFRRLKEIGGGLVIAGGGRVLAELSLPLLGCMSEEPMERLMHDAGQFEQVLRRFGYGAGNPYFSLLFLSSTHLPYIRLTPKGLYDVMRRSLMEPE
ncbi:adenine deaminase C-terminal domain-containing protein [Sporolactobacillus sp. THM19-2]|uniref:adenine deaminase C-terminal domain-containing protein n=1 Tax=Sporolactobacillus sp. THM19-2 TaxID=2511171 RepID=UPI00102275F8|nr:adenine deaminase C-terminal domain-containing protein [Sporolactobacillus sp. THM19-2]RYL90965.1 adenine deaminase [Sporolactobacillus sp. THM19-2]